MRVASWKSVHRFQEKSGWCGPAIIQMALSRVHLEKSQEEIAHDVYKNWWGTSYSLMVAYLSRFFRRVKFKSNATIQDLKRLVDNGNIVIVDWWDDLDAEDPDGHYCIVANVSREKKTIRLVDPTNARKGIWEIKIKDFRDRWYDYLDVHGSTWVDGLLIWIDPKSKIS